MNLISCDFCGVVLDANKLNFPKDEDHLEDNILAERVWDGNQRRHVICVPCPICKEKVQKPE